MRLKNRTAIVTGGASGIGKAIAIKFAGEGAHVLVADILDAPVDRPTILETTALGAAWLAGHFVGAWGDRSGRRKTGWRCRSAGVALL